MFGFSPNLFGFTFSAMALIRNMLCQFLKFGHDLAYSCYIVLYDFVMVHMLHNKEIDLGSCGME